jgi:hypothetical protein
MQSRSWESSCVLVSVLNFRNIMSYICDSSTVTRLVSTKVLLSKNRLPSTRRSLEDNSIRSGRAVLSKVWPLVLDRISSTTWALIPAFGFHLGRGYMLLYEGLTSGPYVVEDIVINRGLFEMIVGVLTTCHPQYTWDKEYIYLLFNRKTLHVFVTYLTGALYVHPLWFYKHQHDNRVHSKLFVACQPIHRCGKCFFKNSLTYRWKWKFLDPSVQLHTPISSVLCIRSF